jgi:pimeloyl-ACP methyl ester carboxylesterase
MKRAGVFRGFNFQRGRAWLAALVTVASVVVSACQVGASAPQGPSQEDVAAATQKAVALAATVAAAGPVAGAPATFSAPDNSDMAGTLYGSGDTVVLLANMQGADQSTWKPFAQTVAAAGYAAFTFDYRGLGASGGSREDTKVDEDARSAIAYLRGQGFQSIVLIGASLGGIACAKNSHEANVSGLAMISSPRSLQSLILAPEDLNDLAYPKLFVASQDDEPFVTEIRTLHSWASVPKDIKLYTGNAHGTYLFTTEHKADFESLLLGFIRKAAGDV